MIYNYLKIAFRSLKKNKSYSFLNIFGLAIGITCASFIFLWVQDEVNYNDYIKDQDLVYYIPTHQLYEGEWRTFNSTPGPLAKDMKAEIPAIEYSARTKAFNFLFSVDDNSFNSSGRYADKDFITIYNLKFIEGYPDTAFKNPNDIIINQEMAEKLFGTGQKALGETVKVNDNDNYVVAGVFENLPQNTNFSFNWVAPFEPYGNTFEWMSEYGGFFVDTFVKLSPNANFETVDAKVRQIIQQKEPDSDAKAFLHSAKDWHLRSNFENGIQVGGKILYVRLFTIIALIILLIACINFMNLATARSEKRANEVGVRKAMGSGRSSLITQFLFEAILLSTLATLLSIFLIYILLPQFNVLIEKDLSLDFTNPIHILSLISITFICGLVAGLYPAFYLSSFKPVEVLKGLKVSEGSATILRKGLVVGQFAVSIIFIVSTILVYEQIQHVKNRDLGYEKDQLLSIKVNGNMIEKFDVIKQDLVKTGVVKSVGLSNSEILDGGNNGSGLLWTGGTNTEDVLVSYRHINSDFLETTGMTLLEGRNFYENMAKDSTSVLISESFAKLMGNESSLGKTINRYGDIYTVVGVVNDYLYDDMYGQSDPVMFYNYHGEASFMYLKTNAQIDEGRMLSQVETVLKTHNPAYPFEYKFVDEAFNAKFKNEQLVGNLSQLFAILAILISCLGLFGLAAYTAQQRKKEIGVRKVLGANVAGIVKLLSKDFLKLVFIAILVAIPIAWYVSHNWLQNYDYRIDISWWIFVAAGISAILIALATVSIQAFKAAITNPVKSLRTE